MNTTFRLAPPRKLREFVPFEFDEQVQIFAWADQAAKYDRRWQMLFATLNGLRLTQGVAAKAKAAGMRRGVLDMFLPIARRSPDGNIYRVGKAVELKRSRGGRLSKSQKWWIARLREQGWDAECCEGAKPALKAFETYLDKCAPWSQDIPWCP